MHSSEMEAETIERMEAETIERLASMRESS